MQSDGKTAGATEAVRELVAELSALRTRAGDPSLRAIASKTDGKVSHSTVADALRGERIPPWPTVAAIVESLGGDEAAFRSRWIAAAGQPPAPTSSEREDALFIASYRRAAAKFFSSSIPGAGASQPRLLDGYEPPTIMRISDSTETQRNLSLGAFDDEIRHAILIGDVGSGKTLLSQALLLRHAIDETRPVAFMIPVRRFVEAAPERSIVGFIEHNLESIFQMRAPAGLIERHFEREPTLVIFDGLDELLDGQRQFHVASIVEFFSHRYPLARILVTSADASQTRKLLDPSLFTIYQIAGRPLRPVPRDGGGKMPAFVAEQLKIIRELAARFAAEPTVMLAMVALSWATLERCLADIVQERGLDENGRFQGEISVSRLIAEAVRFELIAPEDAPRLHWSWSLRNQIVHGISIPENVSRVMVIEAVETVTHTIRHLYR